MKKALITGITGQDGSYLADFLLEKGYEVHGLYRRSSSPNTHRLEQIFSAPSSVSERFFLHNGDLGDSSSLFSLLATVEPDEVYNLAAQSHVGVSFQEPEYTGEVTGLGTVRLLEAIRSTGKETRFYQASSSEMFGAAPPPQNEATPFHPRSPYGVAKVYSYWITRNYRESYGMFATNGILFNHESPRRGIEFVTKKIARAVAMIEAGKANQLELGNLDAVRDWGYAPEYVEAMWKMLQLQEPDDFVVATNTRYSVRDFLSFAFGSVGKDWEKYVVVNPQLHRPAEVDALMGDHRKITAATGWTPHVLAQELAEIMVKFELENLGIHNPKV